MTLNLALRLGAVASSGFTPSSMTGLQVWLDATDASTFTFGTGSQVATWTDKSSNAYVFTRTASTAVQRNSTINGVTAVDMSGTGGGVTKTSVDVRSMVDQTSFTDCMIFTVVELDDADNGQTFIHLGSTSRVLLDMRNPTTFFDAPFAARLSGSMSQTTATPYLVSAYRNGANMKVRLNQVEKLTSSSASGAVASDSATIGIGAHPDISPYELNGRIGEVVVARGYDSTEFSNCETYLKNKWGL
jgi:hypothetical protein